MRYIFHIDVNSAFLSWSAAYRVYILGEKLDLRNFPAIVGGDQASRHGIVLAKSIPAKKYKIHTGEAIVTAKQKCPGLVVIPPDYHLYVMASKALMDILRQYSEHVIQYSIDEAWMELDGYENLYGGMVHFANELREEIKNRLGFTVNIGVSTNYLLAKMAGDFEKPDKVHTLFPWEIEEKMWSLPVGDLFFVGRSARRIFHNLGILSIGDLAKSDPKQIREHLNKPGELLWQYANGEDLEEYIYGHVENKGYGNSLTAPIDVTDIHYAREILLSLCETVGIRLREDNVKITCVSVSITTTEFVRSSMQEQIASPTDITEEIFHVACKIYARLWDLVTPIRQIGVHTSKIQTDSGRQYHLFDQTPYDKLEKVNHTVDRIRVKYGEDSVMRARFLDGPISHISGGLHRERRSGVTIGLNLDKEKIAE